VEKVWAPAWLSLRRLACGFRLRVIRAVICFAREVRGIGVDLLVVPCRQYTLLGTLKVAFVTWLIRPARSVGLAYGNRGFFLDIKVPDQGSLVKHESAWCADILQAAGIPADCREPDVEVGSRHREIVDRLLARKGIRPEHRLVLVHPGGGRAESERRWALKRWPAEKFAKVASELARLENVRVAVTGVQAERPLLEEMRTHGINGVTDLIGETSLKEFSVLARRASLVVGNDCGATHLAAACGAPTIAIFGYTDFIGYSPLGPRVSVLRHPVDCAPCLYWFGRSVCEKSYVCLRGVQPERVVAEAKRLMADDGWQRKGSAD